ncbi:MAG: hypothetical protein MZW92_34200 [Comamonadaceae bacterium]|nr:hypothetical protein [Comamonadaceae bacterium]
MPIVAGHRRQLRQPDADAAGALDRARPGRPATTQRRLVMKEMAIAAAQRRGVGRHRRRCSPTLLYRDSPHGLAARPRRCSWR